MSMGVTNRLWAVSLIALAVEIAGCATPAVEECGATGVLCPSSTHCAAAQGICLPNTNTCGDAHKDVGEACDDGNNLDGDGCSADCKSTETCGNGTLDSKVGEVCDDPLARDTDGNLICSANCRSNETCGNHTIDTEAGEVCDDGNNVDGDGCSHDCKSDERCGNGIVDTSVGEVCDNPDRTKCSADCKSLLKCGNGIVDEGSGEECDDGANNGDDKDCRHDCIINRCGDGFPNLHGSRPEQCDAATPVADHDRHATPTETAGCNLDCTIPSCGDGKVNVHFTPTGAAGHEQCDAAAGNNDNADCTAHCQIATCGDDLHDTAGPLLKETCDDGNRNDNDACTNACIDRKCGDGILDTAVGEECDLGTGNSDTGACTAGCLIAKCGDGKVETNVEQCDHGTNNGTTNDTCSTDCKLRTCGNGILDPGEECDKGTANDDQGDCRTDCIINRCGDGHINLHGAHTEACDDGPVAGANDHTVTPTETANCNATCTKPACGDGIVNVHFTPTGAAGHEQCDDHGVANGDGCSSTCQFETCGNHVLDPGEECDGPAGLQPCSSTCRQQRCGNGILDPGEQCDDGNADDHDDCVACKIAFCGDGKTQNEVVDGHAATESCDNGATNGLDGLCTKDCHSSTCGDGVLDPANNEQCDNGAANGAGKPCNANCRLNVCGDGDVLTGQEQCDNGSNNGAHKACRANCVLNVCGDGDVLTGTEQCDDGNHTDGDGCEGNCTTATCGNGIVDAGENCDDGNANACGSCGQTCAVINTGAATGLLFVGSGPDLDTAPTGGGTNHFSLSDDFANPDTKVTFEYTNGTAAAGNIAIPFVDTGATPDTQAQIATKTAAAINLSKLLITATAVNNVVVLVNQRSSARGNGTIILAAGSSNFLQSPMAGGVGGDCNTGVGCVSDVDCGGGHCHNGSCAQCAANADCGTHLCDTAQGVCRPCKHNIDCGGAGTCTADHVCAGN
jgi:cysteine-rich repeat protein